MKRGAIIMKRKKRTTSSALQSAIVVAVMSFIVHHQPRAMIHAFSTHRYQHYCTNTSPLLARGAAFHRHRHRRPPYYYNTLRSVQPPFVQNSVVASLLFQASSVHENDKDATSDSTSSSSSSSLSSAATPTFTQIQAEDEIQAEDDNMNHRRLNAVEDSSGVETNRTSSEKHCEEDSVMKTTSAAASITTTTIMKDAQSDDDYRINQQEQASREEEPEAANFQTLSASDGDIGMVNNGNKQSSSSSSAAAVTVNSSNIMLLSITELLQELDARRIRYPPTASRQQLEEHLLRRDVSSNRGNVTNNNKSQIDDPTTNRVHQQRTSDKSRPESSSSSSSSSSLSITDLLQRLDDRGIRYPPTASRSQLEQLLLLDEHAMEKNTQKERRNGRRTVDVDDSSSESRPVSYSTAAASKSMSSSNTSDVVQEHLRRRSLRKSTRQQQLRQQQQQPGVGGGWKRVLWNGPQAILDRASDLLPEKAISQTTDFVVRKARQVQRQAQELLEVDEDGVRDAQVIFKRDIDDNDEEGTTTTVVDVQVEPIRRRRESPPPPPYSYSYSSIESPPAGTTRRKRREPPPSSSTSPPQATRRSQRRRAAPPPRPGYPYTPEDEPPPPPQRRPQPWNAPPMYSNILPPANDEQQPKYYSRRPRRRPRSAANAAPRGAGKKIYSPYSAGRQQQPGSRSNGYMDNAADDKDALDRLGDFIADVADKVMWGSYVEDDNRVTNARWQQKDGSFSSNVDQAENDAQASNRQKRSARQPPQEQQQHWKDRLEERFDSLLGIHRGDGYYSSWMEREEEDRQQEEGFDSVSVARGRQPKKRHKTVSRYRRRTYKKPFWQDEGSLLSILFGNVNPSSLAGDGGDDSLRRRLHRPIRSVYDSVLDGDSNGLILNIFRASLHSTALFVRYVCQWATVRGALPQPVVVVGVVAAGLSARPGRRLRAVIIALLALRTIGEVVHGSMFGDEGFEDDAIDDDGDSYYDGDDEQTFSSTTNNGGQEEKQFDEADPFASKTNDEADGEKEI